MQIITSNTLPSALELVEVLKQEFSSHYSYKLFGLGQKSIIVGKSALVGAQISIKKNQITIQATPPTVIGGMLTSLASTELGVFLIPLFFGKNMLLTSKRNQIKKELGLFLNHKYH